MIRIDIYATPAGKEPYSEWEDKLDKSIQAVIKNRLDRVRMGNLGKAKPLKGGQGISELIFDLGPGYRIYFGKQENTVILLLAGGIKADQVRDIAKARQYWRDAKNNKDLA